MPNLITDQARDFRRVRQWGMKARGPEVANSFGIVFPFDGGGLPLSPPQYTPVVEVPANCRIIGCRTFVGYQDALAGKSCTVTFNIHRGAFQDYPSTTLLHDQVQGPTLTGFSTDVINTTLWTTTQLLARDILVCELHSLVLTGAGVPSQVSLILLLRRTPPLQIGVQDSLGNTVVDSSGNIVIG